MARYRRAGADGWGIAVRSQRLSFLFALAVLVGVLVIGSVLAILIGIAAPKTAVVLYLAIAVYLVVPFRDVRRLLFGRP